MKKMIVTLVAMMAVTFSFAETNSNNVDRRFDMSCNMDRSSCLGRGSGRSSRNHPRQLQQRTEITGFRKRSYPETHGSPGRKEGRSEDEERAEQGAVWSLHAHHAEHPAQQTTVRKE